MYLNSSSIEWLSRGFKCNSQIVQPLNWSEFRLRLCIHFWIFLDWSFRWFDFMCMLQFALVFSRFATNHNIQITMKISNSNVLTVNCLVCCSHILNVLPVNSGFKSQNQREKNNKMQWEKKQTICCDMRAAISYNSGSETIFITSSHFKPRKYTENAVKLMRIDYTVGRIDEQFG